MKSIAPLATALAPRLQGAIVSRSTGSLGTLRETAAQLEKLGHPCLALALDEGVDHLGGPTAPPTKLNRADLSQRVATSTRALARTRQAVAMRCLINADEEIHAGLEAGAQSPRAQGFSNQGGEGHRRGRQRCADADRMRRIFKGTPHALTALEMGLKLCADHPQLIALKKEMSGAFEERTAPPVTPAFLARCRRGRCTGARRGAQPLHQSLHRMPRSRVDRLALGQQLGKNGGQHVTPGRLDGAQQARILAYITAAQKWWNPNPQE
ncbi:MAG: hypothetical protein WDN28_30335 [Chthoniobacter sp.]